MLPYLQRALRDADSEVVKAASAALEPYRGAKRGSGRLKRSKPAARQPQS